MSSQSYAQKLKDPRWQKLRLEIMEKDKFQCRGCGSTAKTLSVHHITYIKGMEPWDYHPMYLVTLCDGCHELADDPQLLYGWRLFCSIGGRSRDELEKLALMFLDKALDRDPGFAARVVKEPTDSSVDRTEVPNESGKMIFDSMREAVQSL